MTTNPAVKKLAERLCAWVPMKADEPCEGCLTQARQFAVAIVRGEGVEPVSDELRMLEATTEDHDTGNARVRELAERLKAAGDAESLAIQFKMTYWMGVARQLIEDGGVNA